MKVHVFFCHLEYFFTFCIWSFESPANVTKEPVSALLFFLYYTNRLFESLHLLFLIFYWYNFEFKRIGDFIQRALTISNNAVLLTHDTQK